MKHFHAATLLTIFCVFMQACAPSAGARKDSQPAEEPKREEVKARLEETLETDPNAELCKSIAAKFRDGDRLALQPHFDTDAFVERIVSHRELPKDVVQSLRANSSRFENFAKFLYPEGSNFLCLGTRDFLGEPHIAIRQWTSSRTDYLLLTLQENAERPLTDYFIVSSGIYHSEGQTYYFDPNFDEEPMQDMLPMSYRGEFQKIIDTYDALPQEAQMTPYSFFHYINAVYTVERTGSPLYEKATQRLETVFADRIYSLAYWRLLDAKRRGDAEKIRQQRVVLLDMLDDYELLK